jgi:hypothetical protein
MQKGDSMMKYRFLYAQIVDLGWRLRALQDETESEVI